MSWKTKPLGEVAKFIRGVTFKPEDKLDNFSPDSVVCMRTKNIQELLDEGDLISIPKSIVKRKEQLLQEGDLLVSTANSFELVGKACWVKRLDYLATAGGFISILRPKDNELDRKFLFYWITSEPTQSSLRLCGRQTTNISNLSFDRAEQLLIPLPPLEEQKKIAAVLEKADTLRRKREEQIKRLDDLLQATFLDMFGDPVTNPKGWPVSNLEEIGEITTGSTPPTKEKNMFDGEIPFITPGDLKESWVSAARTVTEDGAKKSRTVMKGATLVCCIGATIGKMGKAAEYAAFNQQINAISWGSLVEHNFGLEMMKFFKQKIALAGASTTLPILNKGLFKKISIPVPPLTLQNSFSKIIHSIEIQKKFFLEQLKTSNNLFASLMQRAFKGELELK